MPDLFIGLVSHGASHFAWNQGDTGLAMSLGRALADRGVQCEVRINTDNLHDSASLELTPDVIRDSADRELQLEFEWESFVAPAKTLTLEGRLRRAVTQASRRAAAAWRFRGPAALTHYPPSAQRRALLRLLNIESSHFDLMDRGLESGATWTLILEDDASTRDLQDAVDGLMGLMATQSSKQPLYVNVSESFTQRELGVEGALLPAIASWAGSAPREVLPSAKPITNTVCAILYRRDFLIRLRERLRLLPQVPVIPIDWKLNEAIMLMFEDEDLAAGDCWTVFPGPFDQLSMRPTTTEQVTQA